MPVSSTSARAGVEDLRALPRQQHLQRPRTVRVPSQMPLGLQDLELVGNAGGGRESDRIAHLPDARRIASSVDGFLDHLQDAPLPEGQAVGIDRSVRQGGQRPGCLELPRAGGRRRTGSAGPAGWPAAWPDRPSFGPQGPPDRTSLGLASPGLVDALVAARRRRLFLPVLSAINRTIEATLDTIKHLFDRVAALFELSPHDGWFHRVCPLRCQWLVATSMTSRTSVRRRSWQCRCIWGINQTYVLSNIRSDLSRSRVAR